MAYRKSRQPERDMTSAAATYVQRMTAAESGGWGDQAQALRRLSNRYGLPFWSLDNLRTGRAKTITAGLYSSIRGAYLDCLQKHVEKLQHEIQIEKVRHGDADLAAIETETEALASRIKALKAS